jgi:hypothetical protein
MNNIFLVSQTFTETTIESAEQSDFSDSGFVFEKTYMKIVEILDELQNQGIEHAQFSGNKRIDLYGHVNTYFVDGSESQNCLHITGKEKHINRLAKIIACKFKLGEIK